MGIFIVVLGIFVWLLPGIFSAGWKSISVDPTSFTTPIGICLIILGAIKYFIAKAKRKSIDIFCSKCDQYLGTADAFDV